MKQETKAKDRLMQAGIKLFISKDFSEISSRALAQEAGLNHALIKYCYGSIGALMDEVIDSCLLQLHCEIAPSIEKLNDIINNFDISLQNDLLLSLKELVIILNGSKSSQLIKAFTSGHLTIQKNVYIKFSSILSAPIFNCFLKMVAKGKNIDPASLAAATLAQLMLAQIMSFFRGAPLVFKHLDCISFSEQQKLELGHVIASSLLETAGILTVNNSDK